MGADTMSMVYPLRLSSVAGSPVYIGTGPAEGTLWGAWEGHLWAVLESRWDQSWWHNVDEIIDLRVAGLYLESERGYIRLGEVCYGGA